MCSIAVIPGFVVGGVVRFLMVLFGGWAEDSDFLYLHALFGFEKPAMIYSWIFVQALPSFVQSIVAGYCAVWAMEKIAKGANYSLAAMITGGLYTGILIAMLFLVIMTNRANSDLLLSVAQCVGLWLGLEGAAATSPSRDNVVA
jgi:hypothetical protein